MIDRPPPFYPICLQPNIVRRYLAFTIPIVSRRWFVFNDDGNGDGDDDGEGGLSIDVVMDMDLVPVWDVTKSCASFQVFGTDYERHVGTKDVLYSEKERERKRERERRTSIHNHSVRFLVERYIYKISSSSQN